MSKHFNEDDVVWAKVRGFPWWPGKISKKSKDHNGEMKYTVDFIGDLTHADLPLSKIENFNAKYDEYSKTKKKNLVSSIEIANKIKNGELTFASHMLDLKRRHQAKHRAHRSDSSSDLSDNSSESWKKSSSGYSKRDSRIEKKVKGSGSRTESEDFSVSESELKVTKKEISNAKSVNSGNLTKKFEQPLTPTKNLRQERFDTKDREKDEKDKGGERKLSIAEKEKEKEKEKDRDKDREKEKQDNVSTTSTNNVGSVKGGNKNSYESFLQEIREAVNSLKIHKLSLNNSNSNKGLIQKLEYLLCNLNFIMKEDFFEIATNDFFSTLQFYLTNKNPQIAIRATDLCDKMKDKVVLELFDYNNIKGLDLSHLKMKIPGFSSSQTGFNNLCNSIIKDINEDNIKTNNIMKTKESTPSLIPVINPKKPNLKVIEDNISVEKTSPIVKEITNRQEESSEEEEEKESRKVEKKVKLPLNKKFNIERIIKVLVVYFGLEGETKNCDVSTDLNKLNDLIESKQNKNIKNTPMSRIFLRKKVCTKLFKVLSVVLNGQVEKSVKQLVLNMDHYAREKDQNLGEAYKTQIGSFFSQIKEEVTFCI